MFINPASEKTLTTSSWLHDPLTTFKSTKVSKELLCLWIITSMETYFIEIKLKLFIT